MSVADVVDGPPRSLSAVENLEYDPLVMDTPVHFAEESTMYDAEAETVQGCVVVVMGNEEDVQGKLAPDSRVRAEEDICGLPGRW